MNNSKAIFFTPKGYGVSCFVFHTQVTRIIQLASHNQNLFFKQ